MSDRKEMCRKIELSIDGRTIQETIEYLKSKLDSVPDKHWIEVNEEHFGNITCAVIKLAYFEAETDHEYNSRIRLEENTKRVRFERYLILKKEFEGQ